MDQGALVFGKDALPLEEPLCRRTRAQGLVHKDDLTSTPGELLDHDDLIGIAAG